MNRRLLVILLVALLTACLGPTEGTIEPDSGEDTASADTSAGDTFAPDTTQGDTAEPDTTETADTTDTEQSNDDAGNTDDADTTPPAQDDAALADVSIPTSADCGATIQASVQMTNTGQSTWTRQDGYKLGTMNGTSPFQGNNRVRLTNSDAIGPSESHTFEFSLTVPDSEGTYTTTWQMLSGDSDWFGDVATADVDVTCNQPPPDPPAPNLDNVNWLFFAQSPVDVKNWSVTANLSSVDVTSNNICLNYDKANVWPGWQDQPGEPEVNANPWVFIWHDNQWWAATFEWMRVGQTCKFRYTVAGDHIKVSPFDVNSGWTPQSGETLYFMVSGLARAGASNVQERSNLVKVVWP